MLIISITHYHGDNCDVDNGFASLAIVRAALKRETTNSKQRIWHFEISFHYYQNRTSVIKPYLTYVEVTHCDSPQKAKLVQWSFRSNCGLFVFTCCGR